MRKIIIFLIILLSANVCWSAKLTFHDGSTLEGKIINATKNKLILEYNYETIERMRNEIASISNLDTAEQMILSEIEQEISEHTGLQKSAYDTLNLLKEKLRIHFEKEKAELITAFKKEKVFLEKNLELLAKKYASLGQKIDNASREISMLKLKLSDKEKLAENYQEKIISLKNELSYINEARLKNEVATVEKIQGAIIKNKKLLEKEKFALVDTYEAQISETEKQLNEANLKTLKLIKENSDLSAKLANSEKLSDQNGNALMSLEKEFENYKSSFNNEIMGLKSKSKTDRVALEKMLSKSADQIGELSNEIKMLNEKLAFKSDETAALKIEIESLKRENSLLEKDKERFKKDALEAFKKQKKIKQLNKENQQKIFKSIVDAVMLEEGIEPDTQLSKDARKAVFEAKQMGKLEAIGNRSALFKLFQENTNKLTDDLEKAKQEITLLKQQNASFKTNAKKSEFQLNEYERQKSEADQRAISFQQEKQELKSDVDKILASIREETKRNLEKGKAELKQEFQKAMESIEKTTTPTSDFSIPSESYDLNITPDEDQVKKKSPITELPLDFAEDSKIQEEPITPTKPINDKGVVIEVGTISQVEEEFSRIFIDTKEILKEKDKVYVTTSEGEISFTIIHIYPALNGAIAEIDDSTKLSLIKVGNQVYIR